MRVAVLIQGEPRFCAEFDHFIKKLDGCDNVDWFFYLWKTSPATSNILGSTGHELVAPSWQNIDIGWAADKLKENLPAGHRIVALMLGDQSLIQHPEITTNYAKETIQSNVWKMWYSQHQVNQLKLKYEQMYNFNYDLVIRSRPDVALVDPVNLLAVNYHIRQKNNLVIIPHNKLCGYGRAVISDLFGMSRSENMNIYTDVYNHALSHHHQGVIFHPETILAFHLIKNKLDYQSGNFNIEFRWLGKWRNIETGEEYTSQTVPTWEGHVYISDFGRWA